MSILYNGNYRIIDLQEWHTWWPWKPVRLTEDWGWGGGPWRWMYAVERRLNYKRTFGTEVGSMEMGYSPPYTYVWDFRDISGEHYAKFATPGFA